mmetsp:Transcript_74481/g.218159  ORF Transcript_74481/g.218159 Transcript_74481/m.218159 type:complete len:214 (-) Transcript_74481:433-1074(-)
MPRPKNCWRRGISAATRMIRLRRFSLAALDDRATTRMIWVTRVDLLATNALLLETKICTSSVSGSRDSKEMRSSQKCARPGYFGLPMHCKTISTRKKMQTRVVALCTSSWVSLEPKHLSRSGAYKAYMVRNIMQPMKALFSTIRVALDCGECTVISSSTLSTESFRDPIDVREMFGNLNLRPPCLATASADFFSSTGTSMLTPSNSSPRTVSR